MTAERRIHIGSIAAAISPGIGKTALVAQTIALIEKEAQAREPQSIRDSIGDVLIATSLIDKHLTGQKADAESQEIARALAREAMVEGFNKGLQAAVSVLFRKIEASEAAIRNLRQAKHTEHNRKEQARLQTLVDVFRSQVDQIRKLNIEAPDENPTV